MSITEKVMNLFGLHKSLGAVVTRWRFKRKQSNQVAAPPVQPELAKPIEYVMNDPSTPSLIKNIDPPNWAVKPPIDVKGYKGGGHSRSSLEGQAANCYVTVANTISFFNSRTDKPVPKWPGASTLHVNPRAGVNLNAYYDRRSLQFFYANDARIGGSMFTCDSSDIVAHELGHAILDAYRPETWSAMSLEVASMHEAFADFTSMMHIMTYDEVLEYVVKETNCDMRKSNVVSRMAEQFGSAIYKLTGPNGGRNPNALRDSVNQFKYVNPGSLPKEAPAGQLAAECHSFGQIFAGALYDIFLMMYQDMYVNDVTPVDALKQARDLITTYVLKAIQVAPLNTRFYSSVAKTMLWADVTTNNKRYHDRMQQIFWDRNILSAQLTMLSAPECDNEEKIIKIQGSMNVKLRDFVVRSQSDDNPLYDVEVEIPTEQIYLYDENNRLYDAVTVTEEESLGAAIDMINHIHESKLVSDDPQTPFEIREGKLIRTHIS